MHQANRGETVAGMNFRIIRARIRLPRPRTGRNFTTAVNGLPHLPGQTDFKIGTGNAAGYAPGQGKWRRDKQTASRRNLPRMVHRAALPTHCRPAGDPHPRKSPGTPPSNSAKSQVAAIDVPKRPSSRWGSQLAGHVCNLAQPANALGNAIDKNPFRPSARRSPRPRKPPRLCFDRGRHAAGDQRQFLRHPILGDRQGFQSRNAAWGAQPRLPRKNACSDRRSGVRTGWPRDAGSSTTSSPPGTSLGRRRSEKHHRLGNVLQDVDQGDRVELPRHFLGRAGVERFHAGDALDLPAILCRPSPVPASDQAGAASLKRARSIAPLPQPTSSMRPVAGSHSPSSPAPLPEGERRFWRNEASKHCERDAAVPDERSKTACSAPSA